MQCLLTTLKEKFSVLKDSIGAFSQCRVFFLLNNKKNNFWSYFAPLINDSFSFWAFWQPLLKLNGVDNVAFKFYIKHTENETKKQEGDFICTVSAVTEFGVSGSFIGLLKSFALQNTAVCIDPFQSLPVSQIFCVLVIVVTPKNIRMQNLSSHFSPFYGEDELLMEWLRSAQRSPSLTTSSLPWANNHVSSQIHTLGVLLLQSINPVFLKAKNLYLASKLKKIKALLLGTSSVTNVEARRWPQIYCKKCVNWRWWYFPKEHLEGVNQKYCKHVSWEHTTGTLVCCAPGPLRVANPNR